MSERSNIDSSAQMDSNTQRIKRARSPTPSESSSDSGTSSSTAYQLSSPPARPLPASADDAPTDVFALLIREYPRTREYCCVAERTASPRTYLSRCMVRGTLRALAGGGLVMQPVAQLLFRTRCHSMLAGDDAETLTHNHNLRYHVLQLRKRERNRRSQQLAPGLEDKG